jgi:hypothetical protein
LGFYSIKFDLQDRKEIREWSLAYPCHVDISSPNIMFSCSCEGQNYPDLRDKIYGINSGFVFILIHLHIMGEIEKSTVNIGWTSAGVIQQPFSSISSPRKAYQSKVSSVLLSKPHYSLSSFSGPRLFYPN